MPRRGFTLIELLVVIAIVAVLAVTVVLTLNPADLLKQARDSTRISDLVSLNNALGVYVADVKNPSLGTSTMVYVSIPDTSTSCASHTLPTLPTGYTYRCAPTSTLSNVDGTGWIPVNLTSVSSGAPLSKLPTDPTNSATTGEYYTYVPGTNTWTVTAFPTSAKYRMGGGGDVTSKDGGQYPELLEKGSDLSLHPVSRDPSLAGYWPFDGASGTLTADRSGGGNNGTLSGGPVSTLEDSCKKGRCLTFDGVNDYVGINVSPRVQPSTFTFTSWVRMTNASTTTNEPLITWAGGAYPSMHYRRSTTLLPTLYMGINNERRFSATSPVSLYDGNWHFIAFTMDGASQADVTNSVLYADGEMQSISHTASSGTQNSKPIFRIGMAGNYFTGLIDEPRLFNRVLSQAEVQALYNATR